MFADKLDMAAFLSSTYLPTKARYLRHNELPTTVAISKLYINKKKPDKFELNNAKENA